MNNPGQTHWHGCATEGGPAHYECAVREVERLRAWEQRWKQVVHLAEMRERCIRSGDPQGAAAFWPALDAAIEAAVPKDQK